MFKNKTVGRYSNKGLIELSTRLANICDANDLVYAATHSRDDAGKPFFKYEVKVPGTDKPIFENTVDYVADAYTDEIIKAIRGVVVSPVSPPAMREWEGTTICYWKRMKVVEIIETPSGTDSSLSKSYSVWVGYNIANKEICRVEDGRSNPGFENIDRVQIVSLGALGKVYAIVPHQHKVSEHPIPTTMGEDIKFKEHMEREERRKKQEEDAKKLVHVNSHLEQAPSSMSTAMSTASMAMPLVSEVKPLTRLSGQVLKEGIEPAAYNLKTVKYNGIPGPRESNEESVSKTIEVNARAMKGMMSLTQLISKPDERYFDSYQKELLGSLSDSPLPHEVKVALIALHGTYTSVESMAFDLIDVDGKIDDETIKNYIPKVLSDYEFEVLSDIDRARYNTRISYLVQIASSKEVREDGHVASGLICDFLTNVAKTDMFLATYLLFLSSTPFQRLEKVNSLISNTVGIYNYPAELSEYLFSAEVLKGETNTHFIAPSKVDDVAKVLHLPLENMFALLTKTGWSAGDPVSVDPKYTSILYGKLNIKQRF